MSVTDARPGDIYEDENGKLWEVIARFDEPSVTVERLCKIGEAGERSRRQGGGIHGLMWGGFKRIQRSRND